MCDMFSREPSNRVVENDARQELPRALHHGRSPGTMKAIWINDIHLEFLNDRQTSRFLGDLNDRDADCILVGGDIAQAPSVTGYLMQMETALCRPIYFVLGNHDFYHGSVADVRTRISDLTRVSRGLLWLNESGVTKLAEKTILVGHDGWGDGRLGDFHKSHVQLNDFLLIQELADLSRSDLLREIRVLGDEAAAHFRAVLPEALLLAEHTVVLTHVPPFLQAAWHDGKPCDSDWLPFFACKAAGDVLEDAMRKHPEKRMTVLCGHTHGGGTAQILPNLITYTGPARYGHPVVQDVFVWG